MAFIPSIKWWVNNKKQLIEQNMNIKKMIAVTGLLALLTVTAFAQPHQSRSFLSPLITSVTISNAASGSLGAYTNILSTGASGTNSLNLTYTNSSGTWVIPTNSTTLYTTTGISYVTNDSTALFQDVSLYSDRNGSGPEYTTNTTAASLPPYSGVNLCIKIVGQSGFTGANLNFRFVGLPDGTNEVTTGTVQSGTPAWVVGVAASTTSPTVIYTNVPMYMFAGCKKLRLQTIQDAVSTAANIAGTVTSISLNGFVP